MKLDEKLIFSVEINGNERGFFIQYHNNGEIWLEIPNAGGMADSVAKYPDQMEWLEAKMDLLPEDEIDRIWPTIWVLKSETILDKVQEILLIEGRLSSKHPSDFY